MKILVMIKQVPDTATQVKISSDPKAIDTAGITWIVSPYDEFAVEEALRIKEKRGQGEVVAVTLGPERAQEALGVMLGEEHPADTLDEPSLDAPAGLPEQSTGLDEALARARDLRPDLQEAEARRQAARQVARALGR